MRNFITIFALIALTATSAFATTPVLKQIDQIQASGGSVLSVPGSGAAFVSDSATQTLTNKTLSGASNTFSNIPASAISSGQLAVAQGGTGASTLTVHGVVIGNGTSPVNVTTAGTSGQVLTSNGASLDPTFQSLPVTTPTLNGTAASPLSVTAGGGVSLSAPTYTNVAFAKGGTASATVTVTATPSITACTAAGQVLYIVSESSTDLFKLQNQADLASSQLLLNGPWTSGENNSSPFTLKLICDGAGTPNWVEVSRNN